MAQVIQHNGQEVWCYGQLTNSALFDIECEDRANDCVYSDGNPNNTRSGGFKNWTEAVHYLLEDIADDIVKVTAI